jgi:hypothetical protein
MNLATITIAEHLPTTRAERDEERRFRADGTYQPSWYVLGPDGAILHTLPEMPLATNDPALYSVADFLIEEAGAHQ